MKVNSKHSNTFYNEQRKLSSKKKDSTFILVERFMKKNWWFNNVFPCLLIMIGLSLQVADAQNLKNIDCSKPFEVEKKILVSSGNRACVIKKSYQPCATKIVRALKNVKPLYKIGGPVKRCIANKNKSLFPKKMDRWGWYKATGGTCKAKKWKGYNSLTKKEKKLYSTNPSNHASGHAIDIYVNKKVPPKDHCLTAGDGIKDWALANHDEYGITEIFWNKHQYTKKGNWKKRKFNKPHYDHVHLSCENPKGENLKKELDIEEKECDAEKKSMKIKNKRKQKSKVKDNNSQKVKDKTKESSNQNKSKPDDKQKEMSNKQTKEIIKKTLEDPFKDL